MAAAKTVSRFLNVGTVCPFYYDFKNKKKCLKIVSKLSVINKWSNVT